MLKQIIEVPLEKSGSIFIEIERNEVGLTQAGISKDIANETLDHALDAVKPMLSTLIENLSEIADSTLPDEIQVGFSLGLKIDASGMLKVFVSTGMDANFNVNFIWNK